MPGSNSWTLRPAAEVDLSDIWLQGASTWGMDQADGHADGLFALFDLLAEFPEIARERTEFSPPMRIHPSGAHLVMYRKTEVGIELIRILHAHQNLAAFLLEG